MEILSPTNTHPVMTTAGTTNQPAAERRRAGNKKTSAATQKTGSGTLRTPLRSSLPIPEAMPDEAQPEQDDRDRPQPPELRPGAPAQDAGRVEQEHDAAGDDDQREKDSAQSTDAYVNHLP